MRLLDSISALISVLEALSTQPPHIHLHLTLVFVWWTYITVVSLVLWVHSFHIKSQQTFSLKIISTHTPQIHDTDSVTHVWLGERMLSMWRRKMVLDGPTSYSVRMRFWFRMLVKHQRGLDQVFWQLSICQVQMTILSMVDMLGAIGSCGTIRCARPGRMVAQCITIKPSHVRDPNHLPSWSIHMLVLTILSTYWPLGLKYRITGEFGCKRSYCPFQATWPRDFF